MATDKNRRAAERRRLQKQMERRRQQAERRKRINVIVSIVAVLVVIGAVIAVVAATSGSDDDNSAASEPPVSSASASTPAPSSSSAAPAYPCTWSKSANPAAKQATVPATTTPPKTGTVQVAVTTSQGALTFTLDRAKAPCAVASFLSLTQQKYFDSTPCHRLTTGPSLFVLQCGDPSGKGSGGPGYQFGDELTGKEQYTQGVLAMANAGPNTNGSQFFVVYKNSQLQPAYTVFGSVTKGLDVVTKVAAKGVTGGGQDGAPATPITLTKLTAAQ